MTKKEYNGWFNYETWLVSLWMDNEQGSSSYWAEIAQDVYNEASAGDSYESQTRKESASCELADRIKSEHEEASPEVTGLFADLINAALSEVNWYEIAEHLLDEVEEEETEEAEAE